MKSMLTLGAAALALVLNTAQAQYHQWTTLNGGNDGDAQALFVKARPNDDQVYVVGKFAGTVDFDPTAGTNAFTSLSSGINDNYDTYIQKLDASGAVLWTRVIQMDEAQDMLEIIDVAVDQDGAVVLLGLLEGSVDVNPGSAVKTVTSVGGDPSLVVIKLNSGGTFYFEQNFPGAEPLALHLHSTDIYIAGNFYGDVDMDYGADTALIAGASGFCLLHISGTGTYLDHIYTAYNMQLFKGLEYDPISNSFYVAGLLNNSIDFDYGPGSLVLGPEAGAVDLYIARISRLTGQFENVKLVRMPARQPFSAQWNAISGFRVEYGMLYLSGVFVDSLTIDPGTNQPFTHAGESHYLACVALDDFTVQWVTTLPSVQYVDLKVMEMDYNMQEIYLAGAAGAGFDPSGNGTAVLGTQETFIARYNRVTGAYKGRKSYTGILELTNLATSSNFDYFYVCGSTASSSTDLDPDGGVVTNPYAGEAGFVTAFGPPRVSVDPAATALSGVYPNPAGARLHFETTRRLSAVAVFSSEGRLVLQADPGIHALDVSLLAPGVYWLRVTDAEGNPSARSFVKE